MSQAVISIWNILLKYDFTQDIGLLKYEVFQI